MERLVEAEALSALLAGLGLLGWADGVGWLFVLDAVKAEARTPNLLVVVQQAHAIQLSDFIVLRHGHLSAKVHIPPRSRSIAECLLPLERRPPRKSKAVNGQRDPTVCEISPLDLIGRATQTGVVMFPGHAVPMDVCPSRIRALQVPRRDLVVQNLFELGTARASVCVAILLSTAQTVRFSVIRSRAGKPGLAAQVGAFVLGLTLCCGADEVVSTYVGAGL